MEPSDRELMGRLAAGDRDALGPLMERHSPRVYRIALAYLRRPHDAMDVVQETFVKAYRSAARWDPGSEVAPWLTRIAVNQAIDTYRRSRRRMQLMAPLPETDRSFDVEAREASPERRAIGREAAERISRALVSLPERQRAVFVLRHYDEMSLDEIAKALDLRLGTVKSSLHRAVHHLRDRLRGLA
jgi:RNA polymerase sigma-70 factor (ECF subfamily)